MHLLAAERRVEITGEAYFEVANNSKQPFIVQSGSTKVKVLGTHFNINGYREEGSVKTTLLEGRVQVSRGGFTTILVPRQQEIEGKVFNRVDIESVIAWKNGIFKMDQVDIGTILRQTARWYDVDIVYKDGGPPEGTLSGEVSKKVEFV